jgi:hypothetical protein
MAASMRFVVGDFRILISAIAMKGAARKEAQVAMR